MARSTVDALLQALNEDRSVNEPPPPAPWPGGIMDDIARVNANLQMLMELEEHSRAIRDLQLPELEEPPLEQQNSLPQSMQVASLPQSIPSLVSALPDVQAVQPARSVNPVPISFDQYLEDIPLAQAQVMQQAYLDQLNLAPAIAAMQQNIDDFAAAQLAAEQGLLAEQQYNDLLAAVDEVESLPLSPVFSPANPFSEESLNADAYAMAHGFGADLFAEPDEDVAPAAVSSLADSRTPVPLELAPFVDFDIPEEDPFAVANVDDEPALIGQPAPAFEAFSFGAPGFADAVAAVNQEQAELDQFLGPVADVFSELDEAELAPFSFGVPGFAEAVANQNAQQQFNDLVAAVGEVESLPLAPEEEVAPFTFAGPAFADALAAEQAANHMAALQEAAQIAEQALSPEDVAEVDALVASLAASMANMPDEEAIPALLDMANANIAAAQEMAQEDPEAISLGMPSPVAQAAMSFGAESAAFPADLSIAQSIADPEANAMAAGITGEGEDDAGPALSPAVAAQSLSALSADFGDPFGAALGVDSLGFSDAMSDASLSVSDPAGMSDATGSDDTDTDPGLGAIGAGLSGLSDVDAGPDPSAAADDSGAADAGAADAAGAAGASDPGGGGSSDSGLGDAFGDAFSDSGFSDGAWASGGRVKKKGLGAKPRGKANGGAVGLAAEPLMTDDMADPSQKVPKAEAKYQDKPRAGRKCGGCAHFLPEQGACEIVKGRISPEGWSRFYEPA